MKILITALFSVYMLGKSLTSTQKVALVLLQIGVIFVQLGQMPSGGDSSGTGDDDKPAATMFQYLTGVAAVLAACTSSGFASVYFERMLKGGSGANGGPTPSIWVRNVQLGLFATIISATAMLMKDGSAIAENGITHGCKMKLIEFFCFYKYKFNFFLKKMTKMMEVFGLLL